MKKIIFALAAPLALASCDSATGGFDGPPALGIVSGNHQVATAGSERLPDPVVGRMVRTPSGGIAFHLVTPAYANEGTVVQGSPIAGAVVCAVATAGELTPFTPCTNTDDHGQARFFFAPGTKAGEARAEIRGTLEGLPAVFDTVVAYVEPGPIDWVQLGHDDKSINTYAGYLNLGYAQVGDTIRLGDYFYEARDAFGNDVDPALALDIPESEFSVMAGFYEQERFEQGSLSVIVPDTAGAKRLPDFNKPAGHYRYIYGATIYWQGQEVGMFQVTIPAAD